MTTGQRHRIRYAQNFLKSQHLVNKLLDKCDIGLDDIIYEIGPGKGIITERLARRCRQVIAIEKDTLLVDDLQLKFAMTANIRLHAGDFLDYRLPSSHYKVFANIPFNITSDIVTRLTTAPVPPADTYLIMQKEAAGRFLGEPRESLYGILLKPCFELKVLHHFQRSDFFPVPRVDVVMLRLEKRGPPLVAPNEVPLFRDFVIYSFTSSQSDLKSIFKRLFTPRQLKFLSKSLDLYHDRTPTSLSFEHWLFLFNYFKQVASIQTIQIIRGSEMRLRQQQSRLEKLHRTRVSRRREEMDQR